MHAALKDADSRVREGAVYGLCDMHDSSAYCLLAEVLQHETDHVRAAAAWGLRDCQDVAAVPVLEAVLKAADPDVRVKGLEALGANQTALAIPVVRHALNDPDPDVQYAATLSWLELAGEACFQDLSNVIEQTCGPMRQQVLRGFFHATNYLQMDVLQSPAADRLIDVLGAALLDAAPGTRMQAVWPLAWIRHERAPGLLDQAYQHESDSEVKAHIVRVAVNLMSPVGHALLQDALHCGDDHIEEVARQIVHEHERDHV
jgi:HEAT repeat protein